MAKHKKKSASPLKKGARLVRVNKEYVRQRREELGIPSDAQLAERCDMTRQNLSRVLHYEGSSLEQADFGSLFYIAQALRCKVDDLVIAEIVDDRTKRKNTAAKLAAAASCIAAVATSWFVTATWLLLDRSVVDWSFAFTSSSAVWFVVYGVLMRQWFLLTNLATQSGSALLLLPGRPDMGPAIWPIAAILTALIMYSAMWTRLNWSYNGGVVQWQPSIAFTRLSQLQTLLPPHFGTMAAGVILGGMAASILEWAAK